MNQETKKCQNCQKEFTIEPEDFEFYEKMKVPAPTWCPKCRTQRRFVWRNERALYKRQSDFSGKDIICLYEKGSPFKIYDQKEWWSDSWDGVNFGRAYNFSRPFFEQFKDLQKEVPRISIMNVQCVKSEYTNQSYENKNCYLCFSLAKSEDSAYATAVNEVKYVFDSFFVTKSELVHESIDSERCYSSSYIINSDNCINSAFLFDCKNCQNCIGAIGLRNKKYIFWGEELSKEEYEKRKKEFDLGGFKKYKEAKEKFAQLILKFPRRAQRFKKCVDCTGDFISNSKNVKRGFGCYELEACRDVVRVYVCKDIYDSYGLGESQLACETIGNQTIHNVKFANIVSDSHNVAYGDLCFNCEHCFGCVGLRKKQYCILNKQYTKEEYEELVPKIIDHMNKMPYTDKQGRIYKYGEFFPSELSPFAYNETIAQEYFPLNKAEAESKGYIWYDRAKSEHEPTMKAQDLPDHIKDVKDDILNEIIECEHQAQCNEQCTLAFKITKQELEFYRKMNLPLPRLCPNCRHYQRLKQRNPLKLWKRQCQCAGAKSENSVYINTAKHAHGDKACPNEFQTTYAPEREEIVYCEKCYLDEVV